MHKKSRIDQKLEVTWVSVVVKRESWNWRRVPLEPHTIILNEYNILSVIFTYAMGL
jgi:hypothetical protein